MAVARTGMGRGRTPRFQPGTEWEPRVSVDQKSLLAAHARGFVETATEKTSPSAAPNQGLPVSQPQSGPLRYPAGSSTQAVYLQ
ncbi:hypothetical protein M440DRAFT_1403345 [Trichoderma longibrachiatum ATCC 18648]|uniref:Uncharacterized protein n=1 Tax=Trichoderma longibrachiatum ATCC 18648 TaxID=983965 RepID=A0A2T4BZV7_TRILO|nr:hypothetical protein M440DRAFT_1403345 [Trichoderma longibrachiatum ATCC 18648]